MSWLRLFKFDEKKKINCVLLKITIRGVIKNGCYDSKATAFWGSFFIVLTPTFDYQSSISCEFLFSFVQRTKMTLAFLTFYRFFLEITSFIPSGQIIPCHVTVGKILRFFDLLYHDTNGLLVD